MYECMSVCMYEASPVYDIRFKVEAEELNQLCRRGDGVWDLERERERDAKRSQIVPWEHRLAREQQVRTLSHTFTQIHT